MGNNRNDKNAAQNLLAGWHLTGSKSCLASKLLQDKLKVLVLDDCYSDWKDAFDNIFGNGNHETIPNSTKEYFIEQRKNNYNEFRNIIKQKIVSVDLIIFDLYFTESHGEEYHSNPENIKDVSGYEIYRIVKGFDQSVPLMDFSTSNKIWTYKLFNSMGIDGFSTKNPGATANDEELKSYYVDFESTTLRLLQPEYKHLRRVFNSINQFKVTNHSKFWWYKFIKGNKSLKRNHIYENIVMAYLSIRRILTSQHQYEISIQYLDIIISTITDRGDGFALHQGIKYFIKGVSKADIGKKIKIEINTILEEKKIAFAQKVKFEFDDFEFDSFSCSSIVSQLGNISEIIFNTIAVSEIQNTPFKYVSSLRNKASHQFWAHSFNIIDVFICLNIVLFALNSEAEPLHSYRLSKQGSDVKDLHSRFLALIDTDLEFPDAIKNLIRQRVS